MCQCVCVCVCVCLCVCEREYECVCVKERERAREREHVFPARIEIFCLLLDLPFQLNHLVTIFQQNDIATKNSW